MNDYFIYNRSWVEEAVQHINAERLLLDDLRKDVLRLEATWPDAVNVRGVLRRIDCLEQSLRITISTLQRFRDAMDKNNAQTITNYEETVYLAKHIFK